jgi:hypothetical protein
MDTGRGRAGVGRAAEVCPGFAQDSLLSDTACSYFATLPEVQRLQKGVEYKPRDTITLPSNRVQPATRGEPPNPTLTSSTTGASGKAYGSGFTSCRTRQPHMEKQANREWREKNRVSGWLTELGRCEAGTPVEGNAHVHVQCGPFSP